MQNIFNLYNLIPKEDLGNKIVDKLMTFMTDSPKNETITEDFLYKKLKFNPIDLLLLVGLINQKNKELKKIQNTDQRKHYGIYYTDYSIARRIANESLLNITDKEELLNLKFFEPCIGVGIFVIAFIDEIFEKVKDLKENNIQTIIDNIYYSDIDKDAIYIFNNFLPLYIKNKYNYKIKINKKNYYIGDILFKKEGGVLSKINPKKIFGVKEGFDIILTNPPYKLLKANSNKYGNEKENNYGSETKELLDFIRKNKIYKYNEGTLNLYKMFVEDILENYTNEKSKIGLLIPITLLNDKQSELLRKRILDTYKIGKIYTIPEKNEFFPDITQSFTFFVIDKSNKTKDINIVKDVSSNLDLDKKGIKINIDNIREVSEMYPIIIEDNVGLKILKKISSHKKIKNLFGLLNLRGELDLTLHKELINTTKTSLVLLKGLNIDEFRIKDSKEYVDDGFLNLISSKSLHSQGSRLVCQQISNINSKKRLKFALIDKNFILGNSCNYLLIEDGLFKQKDISLEYLAGILNSFLVDWRFKITNSNNHISNYEISELPIAIPDKNKRNEIEKLVRRIINDGNYSVELKTQLNDIVCDIYNLNGSEKDYIYKKYL